MKTMRMHLFKAALLTASVVVGLAATTTVPQTESTGSTEPGGATGPTAEELEAVAVQVVDQESDCPETFESTIEADEEVGMTRFETICVDLPANVNLAPRGDLVVDPEDESRLVVADSFSWEGNTPRAFLSFDIEADGISRTVTVTLSPELGLDIEFGQTGDLEASSVETPDEETPQTPVVGDGPDQPVAEAEDATATAPDQDLVVVGQNRRSKSIVVTGRDRGIAGLQIREQVRAGQVRVIAEVDGVVSTQEPELDGDRVTLPLVDGSVTYDLALVAGANFGITSTTQETELLLGNVVMASKTTSLQLEAPVAQVDVQALAQVVGGDDTIVSVRVTNRGSNPITGPLVVTLKPIEGEGLVEGFDDVSDGTIDGNTVTWPVVGDLGPGDQVVHTIQVDLNAGAAGAQIRWEGTLARQGAAAPIDSATVTTDIEQEGSGSEAGVQFTPDQLIRLIAFVMAFALVAVIFGAWNRGGGRGQQGQDEEQHKHELELFRAYTEAILVLVILVAILVLALRGSLSGESAASLIGVIAGYALGRSTSGR